MPDFLGKEIHIEIPHENLRSAYYKRKNIGSLNYVDKQKIKWNHRAYKKRLIDTYFDVIDMSE